MSASDQKSTRGETSKDARQDVPVSGTSLGLGSGTSRVQGKPILVRRQKNGDEIDGWNMIMTSADVTKLEGVLVTARSDDAYSMVDFIRGIEYQGFNREFYIKHALSKMSISTFCRFAIIGALRGSNFSKIVETCDNMPQDLISAHSSLGVVKTPKKRTDLTILRNTASIPHWCAFWMMSAGVTKKIPDIDCPAELQFPGAASLPMSREVRLQHLDFSQKFSTLLPGGRFNMNIYLTAYNNPIPITDIPNEIRELLKVRSNSEGYRLSDSEVTEYSSQLARRM